MAADQVVYIHFTAGESRREWCDRCLTSARLVVGIYVLHDDGPHRIATFGDCTRCDPHLFQ